MAITYSIDATLKIVNEVLITSSQSVSSQNSDITRAELDETGGATPALAFTGGLKGTYISTDVPTGTTIDILFDGTTFQMGSFLFLPDAVGAVTITNTTDVKVNVEVGIINA